MQIFTPNKPHSGFIIINFGFLATRGANQALVYVKQAPPPK